MELLVAVGVRMRTPDVRAVRLRGFLECGVLTLGFVRVHCDACGKDSLVAYSCKGRGFCPSCGGSHMADTAAWPVDLVLPLVPVRKWVLTLPFTLRFQLAYDAGLTADVLRIFLRAVFSSLRRPHAESVTDRTGSSPGGGRLQRRGTLARGRAVPRRPRRSQQGDDDEGTG